MLLGDIIFGGFILLHHLVTNGNIYKIYPVSTAYFFLYLAIPI